MKMSRNRDKKADKQKTRELILNPIQPTYRGRANWLGHGSGRSNGHARVDYLLLDGATMQELEAERGGISSHISHLRHEHDLIVAPADANGRRRFDRQHLGIAGTTKNDISKPSAKVLAAVPPSPRAQDLAAPSAKRIRTTVLRIIRDTQLANWVKSLHEHRCQVCGETVRLADGSGYAEGHHLQPLGAPDNGPDISQNILCLCPNHHAACDLGAIRLTLEQLRPADAHVVHARFIDYHNRFRFREA
jgi:hypothetical protein